MTPNSPGFEIIGSDELAKRLNLPESWIGTRFAPGQPTPFRTFALGAMSDSSGRTPISLNGWNAVGINNKCHTCMPVWYHPPYEENSGVSQRSAA